MRFGELIRRDWRCHPAAFVLVGLMTVTLIEGTLASGDTWTEFRSIESSNETSEGVVVVLAGSNMTPQSSCSNTFIIDANDPFGDYRRAQLQEAEANNQMVSIQHFNTEDDCSLLVLDIRAQ